MKAIAIAVCLTLGTGCASAEARMDSKQQYRDAQVKAIEVQRKADAIAAQAASAERVAMWQALSEAASKNPEVGTHMAIVAAVAVGRSEPEIDSRGNVVQLRKEENTALEWAKVLAPGLVGGITQAGIAAISADVTKRRSDNATRVRIAEVGVDGQIIGAINNAIDELDDDELTTVTTTDDAADDAADDDATDTVDDGLDSGDDTDDTDDSDDSDDTDDTVDCSGNQFSPANPACL